MGSEWSVRVFVCARNSLIYFANHISRSHSAHTIGQYENMVIMITRTDKRVYLPVLFAVAVVVVLVIEP